MTTIIDKPMALAAGVKTGKANYPNVTANRGQMIYNNPHWKVNGGSIEQGDPSSIGEQLQLDVFIRQALIELEKERYFTQMAKVYRVPANSGKVVKKNHYLPVLDDRNVAAGGIGPDGQPVAGGAAGSANLYGSSKNIGKIVGKLPTITEIGGRVNRIGFTRTTLEATAFRLGFFYEWTQESQDFDSDPALLQAMGRESMRAAHEIQEDMIAIDLLKQCPNIIFAGSKTKVEDMTGEGNSPCVVSYSDFERLELMLRENRAPGIISASMGSTKIDTRIVGAGYVLYIGYPLLRQIRALRDNFGAAAFIPVEKYSSGSNVLRGEIGSVGGFRLVLVPEMPEFSCIGAEDTNKDSSYRTTAGYAGNTNNTANVTSGNDYYDVFPMLAVSSDCFTCLGFTGGYGGIGDFVMKTMMPGTISADDPYGETGRTSIKWSYGMMIERPEWLAMILSIAEK